MQGHKLSNDIKNIDSGEVTTSNPKSSSFEGLEQGSDFDLLISRDLSSKPNSELTNNDIEALKQSNQALIQQLTKQSNIINQQAGRIIDLESKERELSFELYAKEQELSRLEALYEVNSRKQNNLLKNTICDSSSISKMKEAESFSDRLKTFIAKIFR